MSESDTAVGPLCSHSLVPLQGFSHHQQDILFPVFISTSLTVVSKKSNGIKVRTEANDLVESVWGKLVLCVDHYLEGGLVNLRYPAKSCFRPVQMCSSHSTHPTLPTVLTAAPAEIPSLWDASA